MEGFQSIRYRMSFKKSYRLINNRIPKEIYKNSFWFETSKRQNYLTLSEFATVFLRFEKFTVYTRVARQYRIIDKDSKVKVINNCKPYTKTTNGSSPAFADVFVTPTKKTAWPVTRTLRFTNKAGKAFFVALRPSSLSWVATKANYKHIQLFATRYTNAKKIKYICALQRHLWDNLS